MASLNDEFKSAEHEMVDKENQGTGNTDKQDTVFDNTGDNAVNARAVETLVDALEEASGNILRDALEDDCNTPAMTSLNNEFSPAESEVVDNHDTDRTDKQDSVFDNTDENAVNARAIETFADALKEASCSILHDALANSRNTDESNTLLSNSSAKCPNDAEMNEDGCVSSQTEENDSHDSEKSNTSENELSVQLQTKRTERSGSFDSCTDDLSTFAVAVDEDAQASCENNSPSKNSGVTNEIEKQNSDGKICGENINDSDCSSDVEKQSIYLSLSDESDNEALSNMIANSPSKTSNSESPSKIQLSRSNSESPSKIQLSPTSWSPRIQNVTSCVRNTDQNSSAFSSKHYIKEEALSDEADHPSSSYHLRKMTPSSRPEVDDSIIIIDKNIKLLDIRINLPKIDCSEYLLKNPISSSPATRSTNRMPLRSRRCNNVRDSSPDNVVVRLPKCKLLLQRYEQDADESDIRSPVRKRRTGKNNPNRKSRRLLGESPQVNNGASSVNEDGDSDSSACRQIVGKKAKKQLPTRRKRSNSDKIVSSTKKGKKWDDRQHHADLNAVSEVKKNRVETYESLSVDKFKRVFNVFYECLCCDQKYRKLDQIKEHVRGHFPDCFTS